ncbi:MAG: hypothetical protein U0795_23985 [Pirellulales bacterium]
MTRVGHNPFATSFTRPGALEFLFPPGVSPDSLLDTFERLGRRAQIVGPHGTGKSTLIATLQPHMIARGWDVLAVWCRADERRLPSWLFERPWTERTVLVIDGYEQLTWWDRLKLRWRAWRGKSGWLVTSHSDLAGPVLWRTVADLATVRQLVHQLLSQQGLDPQLLDERLDASWSACQGNVRELLFALFDEMRQLSTPASIVTEFSDASSSCPKSARKT